MFHEEDGRTKGEGRTTIHHTHLAVLTRLKYFLFFSVDNVERDGFVLQKEENEDLENIAHQYILSIGEIYTLDKACAANRQDVNRKGLRVQTWALT
jgi:hypothetical protein